MIAIDANLLLYAYDAEAREHGRARQWIEETISTAPAIGIPLVSILAFVRIATDRRVTEPAKTTSEAREIVGAWLERDNVSLLQPGPRHWELFFSLLAESKSSGPRTTDAHIAALAIEHGATLYTHDTDFRRFPKLDVHFPLL